MKLAPLPTTSVSNPKETKHSPFPYPEVGKNLALPVVEDQTLTPFLQEPDQQNLVQQDYSEHERMHELENMLSEAQNRAAMIEQEAYDKAYAAGEKSGLALGEKRAEQVLESMQTVLMQAESELALLQSQSVDAVMDISHAIIAHAMGEVGQDLEKTLGISVKQAMNQFLAGYDGNVILAVNNQDLNMFKRMTDLPEDMKIRTHQGVLSGSCRLMTTEQDLLIDPKQSIEDAVAFIRENLQAHD